MYFKISVNYHLPKLEEGGLWRVSGHTPAQSCRISPSGVVRLSEKVDRFSGKIVDSHICRQSSRSTALVGCHPARAAEFSKASAGQVEGDLIHDFVITRVDKGWAGSGRGSGLPSGLGSLLRCL